ncbi:MULTISPECIES: hypothetical protein [unclassified Candidatus Tisiphia]|uniref:hypothetical protein n=1 Tax=unclassified Candidatus Tisiphia TaxID=2996318 RepID=UPI00312C7185
MIKKKRLIITMLGLLLLSSNSIATTTPPTKSNANQTNINSATVNSDNELQKIIDEFISYAAGVSAKLREEIKEYRIAVAKLNGQKRDLYNKISQEAQEYFRKEREYKKRISSLRKNQENPKSTENKSVKKDSAK